MAIVCRGLFLFAGLLTISGCGPGDGRLAVSGAVVLDGNPLDGALISFRPSGDTQGPSSGGSIQQGRYEISAANGLLPGTYDVTIVAMKETGRIINDPQKGQVPELVQVRFQQPPGQRHRNSGGDERVRL